MPGFSLSDKIISQSMEGELILVDLSTDNYFGVSGVSEEIWKLLEQGLDEEGIRRTLAERYPDAGPRLEADLSAFLKELLENGLIQPAGATPVESGATP